MNNDILLNRKIRQWGWYKNSNTKDVFLELLLTANWKDGEYLGHKVLRGQCVFGRKELAQNIGISEQAARTAINHLISTNEITINSTNKYSIATIVKYDDYQLSSLINNQQDNQQNNFPSTNNQPTTNQQLTTSNSSKSSNSLNTSSSEQNSDEENSEKKKRKQPIFDHESKEYKLATCLDDMIRKNNPSAKQQAESGLQHWARDFDLTIRIDKRTAHDIYEVMKWCQKDNFWKSNILSAGKLREKYDQLVLRMKQENQGQQAPKGYDGIRKL